MPMTGWGFCFFRAKGPCLVVLKAVDLSIDDNESQFKQGPDVQNNIRMVDSVPLQKLLSGQSARVLDIVGRSDHVHRLREFGLRQGSQIQMFRTGNPCILHAGGNKICLRTGRFLNVLVKPDDEPR